MDNENEKLNKNYDTLQNEIVEKQLSQLKDISFDIENKTLNNVDNNTENEKVESLFFNDIKNEIKQKETEQKKKEKGEIVTKEIEQEEIEQEETEQYTNEQQTVINQNEELIIENKKEVHIETTQSQNKIKILFAAFEVSPFIKTGGLGDVAGALPNALNEEGTDTRVIMPLLQMIDDSFRQKMKKIGQTNVPLGWRNQYLGIFELKHNGITYYLLDNEYYFKREKAYGYFDDGERIAYFSKALLEALQVIDFEPDILHLNDWHTALSAVFLREMYMQIEKYKKIKTILTVHNLKFQGKFSPFVIDDIAGFAGNRTAKMQLSEKDACNFMRGGLNYVDYITTVSPTYAQEIKTAYYGEGLNDIFVKRHNIVKGILNGIDTNNYNPLTDEFIYKNYDINSLENKYINKIELQKEKALEQNENIPLICMVSRLTEQKGIDLVLKIFEELIDTTNAQFVLLGTGDSKYENSFRYFEYKYKGRVSSNICFSEELSRKIYAASDMIMIPSRFEPCGLTQMIAMRYLTLPIVRETGGLKDTVIPYNQYTDEGNGFSFSNYNAHELLWTTKTALELYNNYRNRFDLLIKEASKSNFDWKSSAKEYIDIYKYLLSY